MAFPMWTVLVVCLLELFFLVAAHNCTQGTDGLVLLQRNSGVQRTMNHRWNGDAYVPDSLVKQLRKKLSGDGKKAFERRAKKEKSVIPNKVVIPNKYLNVIPIFSNEKEVHALFGEACLERPYRWKLSHQQGLWHEDKPAALQQITMKVLYSIRDAGFNPEGRHKGLGLFAEEDIEAGQPIYGNWSERSVQGNLAIIPYKAWKAVKSVAKDYPTDVIKQFFEWCEDNWLTDVDGMLCEMDNEHYANHDPKPNMEVCEYLPKPLHSGFNGMCAVRDIKKGEELTENYDVEMLDNDKSTEFLKEVEAVAGTGNGLLACGGHM